MAKVSFRDIDKIYPNGVYALKKLSLEVEDGSFLVLVGPSGCGKSTALRIIAGLEEITDGTLEIGGKRVNDIQPKDRDIAMVFQNYALYPTMTVYQNMALGLELRKLPKCEIKEKIERAAEVLDITELLKRKPGTLSGGQKQRVALGRAMVRNPSVFLLDEPLSNLDAKLRTQMRLEISKLHKALGQTFIYVTHDQIEAMTMGDKIAVLNEGVLQQLDTPQNIYKKPVNMFVAGFIGSPSMNFLTGRVVEKDGEIGVSACQKDWYAPEMQFLKPYVGKEIVLGIRPEDIRISSEGISAKHEFTELLGGESILYMNVFEEHIAVKGKAMDGTLQGDAHIELNMSKAHFFDKETQNRIE